MRRLELKAGGRCGRWTLVEEAPKSNLGAFATERAAAAAYFHAARERYRLEAPAVPLSACPNRDFPNEAGSEPAERVPHRLATSFETPSQ